MRNGTTPALEQGGELGNATPAARRRPYISEAILEAWELHAEDRQHIEIIRLAKIGLWAEQHSVAVEDALSMVISRLPVSAISRFEKALDARKRMAK